MGEKYKTIYKYGKDEIDINKSKFIGYAKPVDTEEEALAFIEKINKKHYDATHNCYAYIIGQNAMIQRFNDDGEPSGTAGIPMLEVLKKEELVNIVTVATRYFGGVKLGAGGLIRAYTKTAKIGLESGIIIDMLLHKIIKIRLDYTLYGQVENYILSENIEIKDSTFDDAVNLQVYVKEDEFDKFEKKIVDLTSGTVEMEIIGEKFIPIKNGKVLN